MHSGKAHGCGESLVAGVHYLQSDDCLCRMLQAETVPEKLCRLIWN